KLFFVHNKIPVSECIISETGIYTNCGRGSQKKQKPLFSSFFISYFFLRFHTIPPYYTRLEAVFFFSYSYFLFRIRTLTTAKMTIRLTIRKQNIVKIKNCV
ncbi:hypothetical protein, partial [Glaesserella parasuis]